MMMLLTSIRGNADLKRLPTINNMETIKYADGLVQKPEDREQNIRMV